MMSISLSTGKKDITIRAEEPPWPLGGDIFDGSKDARTDIRDDTGPVCARLKAWAIIQLAEHGKCEDVVFRRGTGKCFDLIPGHDTRRKRNSSRSPVPLQWAHHSPSAIPPDLADRPCADMGATRLLSELNDIFGTDYAMEQPLRRCLKHFLHTLPDLGSVYGVMRPYWTCDLDSLPDTLTRQQEDNEVMRQQAVKGHYLRDAEIPPRRVWDLHSNRVLPYHVLPAAAKRDFPDRLWTVSHSWVDEDERTSVVTSINGGAWPVPIPQDTTLDHVRVELLNLGAEYAWLDVLCLRQVGDKADEPQREDEWKLDIPTIGYIYAVKDVPCVTYFNGLGLPFDPSREARHSPRHWLQRVWTVQESTHDWLPGGITSSPLARATSFFHKHHTRGIVPRSPSRTAFYPGGTAEGVLESIVRVLAARHATSALDSVSSLAYVLACPTRPLYDAALPAERAWAVLLKHLAGDQRAAVALRHMEARPASRRLLPTWEEFLDDFGSERAHGHAARKTDHHREALHLADGVRLGSTKPGAYWQDVVCAGPYVITSQRNHSAGTTLQIGPPDTAGFPRPIGRSHRLVGVIGGQFDEDAEYILRRTRERVVIILRIVQDTALHGRLAFEVERCGAVPGGCELDPKEEAERRLVYV